MERFTGLLLGAGASAEAGMPLAWDLTAEIKAWLTPDMLRELNEGWRGGGYSDAVIEDLAAVLVAALGDPVTAGKQWATEVGIGPEETLGRILDHLAKVGEA